MSIELNNIERNVFKGLGKKDLEEEQKWTKSHNFSGTHHLS